MSSRIFVVPESLGWKKAYMAAILERDRSQVPELVQQAKRELFERLHELWAHEAVPCDESEAIDDALYLLDALLSSLPYRHDMTPWVGWDHDC